MGVHDDFDREGGEQVENRAAMCEGKEAFETPQMAHRVAKRRREFCVEPYRCRFCGLFHIGKPIPKPPKGERIVLRPKWRKP